MTSKAVFMGVDASGSIGLWITDGTAPGTHEIVSNRILHDFGSYNGQVLFAGFNASYGGYGLWITDGTSSGTHEITGISGANTGQLSDNGLKPAEFTPFSGQMLFVGDDNHASKGLWITDGTAAGTHELAAFGASQDLSGVDLTNLIVLNGQVLFQGQNGGLWTSNGTVAGTHQITSIAGGSLGLHPNHFTIFNGQAFFEGYDDTLTPGLWVTNGTAAGTHAIATGVLATDLIVFNGKLLFADQQGGLWVSDGTAAGTHVLTGIAGAVNGVDLFDVEPYRVDFPNFTVFNGKVLFEGYGADGKFGLWTTDGTAAGTHELTGINGASANGIFAGGFNVGLISWLTALDNTVLFEGLDAQGKLGLWATDGTAAGTHEINGISNAGSFGVQPQGITAVGLTGAPVDLTTPALSTYQKMYGVSPSSVELSKLVQFDSAQYSYGQAIGVQDSIVYVYQALGQALAEGSDTGSTAFKNTWGPTAVSTDTTFATQAYVNVFGSQGSAAQIQHFVDQISFFKSIYTTSGAFGGDASRIDLLARGAVYGQMLGVKAENSPSAPSSADKGSDFILDANTSLVGLSSSHDLGQHLF